MADASGLIIRDVAGELLTLTDLSAYVSAAWICARDEHSWRLACQAAIGGKQPPEIERHR
jgi:hypothetical protein